MNGVFVVVEGDCDGQWPVVAYASRELADADVAECGGSVYELTVTETLRPEVVEANAKAGRARTATEWRRTNEEHDRIRKQQEDGWAKQEPREGMKVCACILFHTGTYSFVNTHGVCTFCGGVVFAKFRELWGEEALQRDIDKLALYQREQMRRMVAGLPKEEHDGSYAVTITSASPT